jgi:restriction system protein
MTKIDFTFDEMMNPVLNSLRELGGSGNIEEINEKVAEILQISSPQIEILHDQDKGGLTEFEYRLMWTRTYLKKFGLLENSSRGIWSLTKKGIEVKEVDPKEVVKFVRKLDKKIPPQTDDVKIAQWQEELLGEIQKLSPGGFERLTQRLLRESGFIQVEVTGQSGDGGVDGHGIMRLGGLLSFHVIFQCKRWKGTIGSNHIRDFRGAMVGRADKGLFITTGTFSKDAIKEAVRDGAPAIDLVDGDQLVELIKRLNLGVDVQKREVEDISINYEWFKTLELK